MISKPALFVQAAKFGLVGVANTAIHYIVFYVLYVLLGVYYLLSSTIGYGAGLLNSYVLNKTWTFQSKGVDTKMEFGKFVLVNLISLGTNLAALNLFVVQGGLRPEVAQAMAIFFSLAVNFAGNKFWTFNSSANR